MLLTLLVEKILLVFAWELQFSTFEFVMSLKLQQNSPKASISSLGAREQPPSLPPPGRLRGSVQAQPRELDQAHDTGRCSVHVSWCRAYSWHRNGSEFARYETAAL